MKDFLSALQDRVLICDGAMGTMLYSKGIFISRCFDELNLSKPQLVREVHLDYVKVGVDIIETNTFGGNRTKLMSHALEAETREINVQATFSLRAPSARSAFELNPGERLLSTRPARSSGNRRRHYSRATSTFSFSKRFPI